MAATDEIQVVWNEDGSATALGRVTARDASGSATGVPGEGKFLQQADLSTITCSVFDLNSSTPDTAIATPTVTISSAILDTVDTATTLWDLDEYGYNFRHDLAHTNFPTGDHVYLVEYKFTTTGSAVFWGRYRGPARSVRTS